MSNQEREKLGYKSSSNTNNSESMSNIKQVYLLNLLYASAPKFYVCESRQVTSTILLVNQEHKTLWSQDRKYIPSQMQMEDCFQFLKVLLLLAADELISDQKQLQVASQQFHHHLQPKRVRFTCQKDQ